MALPLATTTITVLRSDQDGTADAFDTLTYTPVAANVRAVIGSESGTETNTSGSSENLGFRLDCDVCDVRHDDRIEDENTGDVFEVEWVWLRTGLGLDHMEGQLRRITDRAAP